ncbi:hypothetical protein ACIRL2_26795 [Embleya sp. NPDC127516]|uniref:hypothetical protein n=1 Tax=Embleya sp. NPDC127516 TaxID=3363990 RepID=UPI0038009992
MTATRPIRPYSRAPVPPQGGNHARDLPVLQRPPNSHGGYGRVTAAELVEGPAFRTIDRVDRIGRIGDSPSPNGCCAVITRVAERAGLPVRLAAHSGRAGRHPRR